MLKIRMQRTGKINQPSFRIIVTEHTRGPKTGNVVEKVGTFNPKTKERNLNEIRIKHWLSVGAQASATVHNMLVSAGVVSGKKINILPAYKAPAEAAAEAEAKEAEKAAEQEVKAEAKAAHDAEVKAEAAEKEAAAEAQTSTESSPETPEATEDKPDPVKASSDNQETPAQG